MRRWAVFVSCGSLLTSLAAPGCSSPSPTGDAGAADAASDARGPDGGDAGPCADGDGDGHAAASCGGDDCDDANAARHPGATETCDAAGVDEDCDPATVGTRDADGDGFQDHACCNGTSCGADCDDQAVGVHPDAPEVCNSRDDDCDTATDEGVQITFYADCDGDGVGAGTAMPLCAPSSCSGHPAVTSSSDCDDTRPEARPGASETCNGRDDDCNGTPDDGTADASCPAVANGTAACVGGTCGASGCASGFHVCTGLCVPDASITQCGPSCMPCPAPPAHGMATCDGTSCDFVCTGGYARFGALCDVPVPRLIAPMSTATATTRRPTFRWQLATGTTGARVELCADRACTTVSSVIDQSSGTSVAAASDLPHGVVFWRVRGMNGTAISSATSPVWELFVPARTATHGTAWGTTPDVNGDGYADLLVGAQSASNPSGAAYVYLGSASGIGASPATTLSAPDAGAFGTSIASAGDVNGDGFGDVIVGAPGAASAFGAAYVYLGGASGLSTTPALTLTGPSNGSSFGVSVAGLGDANGDGYGEVAVGAPFVAAPGGGTGAAYAYAGSASGIVGASPVFTIVASSFENELGRSVQTGGDVNADGYADLLVASRSVGHPYLGSATGLGGTVPSFMIPVARIGYPADVDGDGCTDVIASSADDGLATSFVFRGHVLDGVNGAARDQLVQRGVASGAGDVNGDGYDDVVCTGGAHLFLGGAAGLSTTPEPAFGSATATSARGLGDVNGDGFTDVGLASQGSDRVEVFHGIGGTQTSTPARTLSSPGGAGAGFGASIARAACIPASDADARRTPWCEASDTAG